MVAQRGMRPRLIVLKPGFIATSKNDLGGEPVAGKIMVIDDSQTIRRTAETLLSRAGYTVVTAKDGFEALAKIAPERPGLRLRVIGTLREGPTKRMLDRTGLSDRVEFRAGLTRTEIAHLFRRAGLFVSASRFEGFGFPPAEAMACGAPVVVSDGGALPEVAGDAGIVTPVGDAQALARAIAHVVDNRDIAEAMSARGAEWARSAFVWDHHAQAAISLYHEVIQARTEVRAAQ